MEWKLLGAEAGLPVAGCKWDMQAARTLKALAVWYTPGEGQTQGPSAEVIEIPAVV